MHSQNGNNSNGDCKCQAVNLTNKLPCGVMVARRILVPPVRVRILPRQHKTQLIINRLRFSFAIFAQHLHTEVLARTKLERDPKEKHQFILTIDCVNVFQWFRNKAKELLAKLGIKISEIGNLHRGFLVTLR